MEEGRSTSLRLSQRANKLTPKDISESLGKLPPQAIDLEEAVLGAVMLEKTALPQISYLKPEHFYLESHKLIFQAIKDLEKEGKPCDMRLVVFKLRENGKLDLIPEGAYFIAEITSKISSAENIDHHGRVIVEMSMKRELIQIASKIYHDAYRDQTDVFELFDTTLEDINFLYERETKSTGPERIKVLWEKLQIKTKPERPETLIQVNGADVCTVGNISLVIGKKKSRKSLLVTYLIQLFLQGRTNLSDEIVWFDTEQEEYDVWEVRDRIYRMTNQLIPIFCLRGLNPKERREFISMTVANWHKPLKIGVIDGTRDCMSNINDPDETTEVMSWMMGMNVNTKIHFINVLHINKTDNNARGHIGTELLNKAWITIEVEYDDKTTNSIVKVESARRKPFEPFAFTHGPTGLPEMIGAPEGSPTNYDEQISKLARIFEGEALRYKELWTSIKDHFEVGESKAKRFVVQFTNKGWIMKSGGAHASNATYKLVVKPGQTIPTGFTRLERPPELFEPPPIDPPNVSTDDLPF